MSNAVATSNVYNIEDFGVIANDKSLAKQNTTLIQEAIDHASELGGTILIPAKTYYFAINSKGDNGLLNIALYIRENVTFKGVSRKKSILELVSPSDRYYIAVVMADNTKLRRLTIKDDVTNNQQPSSVGIGGTDNCQGLIEAGGHNVVLDHIDIYNSSTWAVYSDDGTSVLFSRKDNLTMFNCTNYWTKRAWYTTVFDVSQVYAKLNRMNFQGNKFYTSDPNYSRTVFDLSGNEVTVRDNLAVDYVQPLLLMNAYWAPNDFNVRPKFVVEHNHFDKCKIGVLLYPVNGKTMKNVSITHNTITVDTNFSSYVWDSASSLQGGISIEPNYHGTIENAKILDNDIEWMDKETILTHMSLIGGIHLFNGAVGGNPLKDVIVSRNTVKNFPFMGISVGSFNESLPYYTENVKIHGNVLIDNGISNNYANQKSPFDNIYVDFYFSHIMLVTKNVMRGIDISDNTIIDTGVTEAKGTYWLTTLGDVSSDDSINVGENELRTVNGFELGTTLRRKSSAYGVNTGLPFYRESNKLSFASPSMAPIKFCANTTKDIINYDTGDIVLAHNGVFVASHYGTTGVLVGVTITARYNDFVFDVSDGSKIKPGNVISWGSGGNLRTARVDYVKGNRLKVVGTNVEDIHVGSPVKFDGRLLPYPAN